MMLSESEASKVSWRLIALNYKSLYGICLKAADYDPFIADEFMSDCVYEKMPHIVTRWYNGPRLAPIEHYTRSMIYWYLRKHRARIRKRERGHVSIIDYDAPIENNETGEQLEVQVLLESLKPTDRQMIQLVYYEGHSMQECANIMSISIGNVSGRLKRVFKILRQNNPEWLD